MLLWVLFSLKLVYVGLYWDDVRFLLSMIISFYYKDKENVDNSILSPIIND